MTRRDHLRPGCLWRGFRRLVAVAAVALLVVAGGCSSDDEVVYEERPVDELYNEAMDAMEVGNFRAASGLFDEVERQHPYSPWATKAQLMAAYAFYQGEQYDEAVAALDRFVQLHPANPDVPYAHYMKGLCYYEQISDVNRDQEMTELSRQSFEELVSRYPDSQYSRDGKVKLDLIYDHLAGKEMTIGRYYLRQGHYLASINRFKRVIDIYQTTTHVPEALHRLVEAYAALGLHEEAKKVAAVLGYNYPGSEWYVDSYDLIGDESTASSN